MHAKFVKLSNEIIKISKFNKISKKMKKFILMLALVCSATMGFASSAVDSAEVKKVFAKKVIIESVSFCQNTIKSVRELMG